MTLAMNPGKQGIVPCLWFDNQALEAAQLYTGLFPDSAIEQVSRYPADSMGREGAVLPRRLGDIFSAGGETAKKLWQAIAPLQKIDFAVIDRVIAV